MRKTHSLIKIMDALLEDPTARHWGYELSRRTGIRSGVMYPILKRMLACGWLEDGWESGDEVPEGRPPRRYYRVTGEGQEVMRRVLADAQQDQRFHSPVGQPA